jgi:hypothetical protein
MQRSGVFPDIVSGVFRDIVSTRCNALEIYGNVHSKKESITTPSSRTRARANILKKVLYLKIIWRLKC